jgi:hypothetical protein
MSMTRPSAHPILEPLDYELTPEHAAALLQDEHLEIYSLLWNAALATAVDGPALRVERLSLEAASDDYPDSDLRLQASRIVCEDSGWGALLPHEQKHAEAAIDPLAAPFPPLLSTTLAAAGKGQLDATGQRHHDASACAPLARLLGDPGRWQVDTVLLRDPALTLDRLVEQMAQGGIGRPSTFASRVSAALDNDLIRQAGGRVVVGDYGREVLEKRDSLPAISQIDATFSADLERALEQIETESSCAGEVLQNFTQRALGEDSMLADWLDELVIDGESMTEAAVRAQMTLPAVGDWAAFSLPASLSPEHLVADAERARQLRKELDGLLAGANRRSWKQAAPRERAAARLAALEGQAGFDMGPGLLKQSTRDLALRWWIDLAPDEYALNAAELAQASRRQAQLDPLALQRLSVLAHELATVL